MDTFLLSAAIKGYEKTLKVLVSSSGCLITGGMVTDVLHSRNVIQEALNLEVDKLAHMRERMLHQQTSYCRNLTSWINSYESKPLAF